MTTLVELREYEPDERSLSASDAHALQETGLVDVQPDWKAGNYRLKAGPKVGVLALPDGLTLRVIPKLPVRRVVYLLCHAAELATWDDSLVDLDDDAPIDVALGQAFVSAAEHALRRGPRSSYYTVEDDLAEIRGRIDTNRQRLRYGLPLPMAVVYDEYGADIPENQLVLGAAIQLQRLAALPATLRRRLRRIVVALDGVTPARRGLARTPVHFHRLNEHYRPAIALARAALEGVSFDVVAGRRSVTGFIINMNRLFERFLEVALREALADHDGVLKAQRSDHLDQGRLTRIIPDFTWMKGKLPSVVIDAKYKDPSDGTPADDDVYQIVSYCVGLGTGRGFLVHATRAAHLTLAMRTKDIEITATGLDLSAPLHELRQQLVSLAETIAAEPWSARQQSGNLLPWDELVSTPSSTL